MATALTLTGVRPASAAAAIPFSTSVSRSRRVSWVNVSASMVSRLTLTRSSPASASRPATRSRPTPLVVIAICGRGSSAAMPATTSTIERRSSGSPPVSRICRTPSPTNTPTTRSSSSSVSISGFGSQGSPSAGMQYVHRRLQRSVTETRRSRATRPNWSGIPTSPGAPTGRSVGIGQGGHRPTVCREGPQPRRVA